MGANSSSLSELNNNEYLRRLSGTESIQPSDPFWNQLLSYTFQVPRNSADQRLLEEQTSLICKNFAVNNCRTGNFGSLTRVFILRATELKASAQCEDNIFTWQTFNALFIIRNVVKYFVENLSEEVILKQFDTPTASEAKDSMGCDIKGPLADELMNCLVEILVDVPVVSFSYSLHLEALNALVTLLSVQMFQPTPAGKSAIYKYIMQGKCSIHSCVLMKTLLQNYINQEKCPPDLLQELHQGSSMLGSLSTGLWNIMTLGMAKGSEAKIEIADTLLASQSLLLILILTNHCTSERNMPNPYRQALFSFSNSQDQTPSSPTNAVATFKVDFSKLYETLCKTLKDDQTTLLLYLLLHQNSVVKSFMLSRTNIDELVMPILQILYHAPEKNSHHIYMALIVLLILSEDDIFNKAVHEMNLKNVSWFKERPITEITLGGLLILVVIRTIQYNMTRMRDKYLHTNCLAALANMSAQFQNLHPYVTQRLVSLLALLQKKHNRLVEQIRLTATGPQETDSGSEITQEEYIQDLGVLEEVIRMVLEIINSTLSSKLHHNHNLVYTLLYNKELFSHFRTHPTFQDIIQNIDTVLSFFTRKVEQAEKNLGVHEVHDIIKQGSLQFKMDRLKKFPELKFKYVEEDQPEEFFIPYVWSLVYHSSNLYFNASRIQLFTLQHAAGDEEDEEESLAS